ncbi:MAG: class I SAM-dependent methyltransferase [Phycisphaerae bacterium]|nr:class I SAM-dependent methyltransferase [Phycisphaerae bacterium]
MGKYPTWQFDEFVPCGVDYGDRAVVGAYDSNHGKFRDYDRASAEIIGKLGLREQDTVVDMGCGTGGFALRGARHCKRVYAVDVSEAMLDYARVQADQAGLSNIEFHRGGFLTYEHVAEPADAMVSVAVLHHLPDFWKLIGLRRAAAVVKPGGRLYLFDVVFSFPAASYESFFDGMVRWFHGSPTPEFAAELETHIRQEYSTFDWVMEGLLRRAGFRIDEAVYSDGAMAAYVCTREAT